MMPKTPKQPNKDDPEYLEKRKRNNEAIKKSREKAKEKDDDALSEKKTREGEVDEMSEVDKRNHCSGCNFATEVSGSHASALSGTRKSCRRADPVPFPSGRAARKLARMRAGICVHGTRPSGCCAAMASATA